MEIFGVTLELDLYDADVLEVYEREAQKVANRIKEPSQYQGKSTSEAIRIQCRIVEDFFDSVFGRGTADRLFHGKSNIKDHMEAFAIITSEAEKSGNELKALANQYVPNRAERRYGQKHGQNSNFHGNGRNHGKNRQGSK